MRLVILAFYLALTSVSSERVRLAPQFVVEPPARVRYAAAAGTALQCRARADPPPTTAWLAADGSPLGDVPGIRRVHSNGTLEIFPAAAEAAPAVLRCRAANPYGVLLSRDVWLEPVPQSEWEVRVSVAAAAAGGVAALSCRAGAAPAPPALFYRGDSVLHLDAPTPESRYILAGETLLIRDVTAADAGPYSCVARHTLTALSKRSRPAHLAVMASSPGSAPRLVATAAEVSVAAGAHFCIPCVSSDYPPPQYTWYREQEGRLQPVLASAAVWPWAGGAALCVARAHAALAGAWLCKAYNLFGDATAQTRLTVEEDYSVTVVPSLVVAEAGSTVRLNCSCTSPLASLSWVHDGAAVRAGVAAGGAVLELRRVARAHAGLYQCEARAARRAERAAAELRLGDSPPELQYTFIEQALRAGGGVALRCSAAAQPPPRLTWLLDRQPLDRYLPRHKYSISEESSAGGEVTSVLNLTAAAPEEGGLYSCRADNPLGAADHSARLNIYGPPVVRAMSTVRAVAGENLTVLCPYAGYPISAVWWTRRGGAALSGGRADARGAELRLAPALPSDAGHYACSAAAPGDRPPTATASLEIVVRNPPKISPFMFSSELTEGSSVQVLCGVSSGDKPLYFSWLKDGAPLPPNLQIEEKSLNEFSLLVFPELTARHSGRYTCRVANHAAAANYTATLSVKVAPSWVREPQDAEVVAGAPLRLECAAAGHPAPTVLWYKRIGEGIEGLDNSERWEVVGSEWEGAGGVAGGGRSALAAAAAARSHRGRYRCSADNGVGVPLLKHVNVSVYEPAHFGPESESAENLTTVRGHSAALSCLALGDPPLSVHWTHGGVKLDLDSYRWTVSELRLREGLRSALQLRAATRADAGEYRCVAQNRYGRAERTVRLRVTEPPEAPQSLRLGGAGSRWARVRWRAAAAPTEPVTVAALLSPLHAAPAASSPLHYNLTLDDRHQRLQAGAGAEASARLEALRPGTAYSLRLVASNRVGQSPHSDALIFTTLEEAPSAPPQHVRVRPVNSEELHVEWAAPAQDSWNGELLGYAVSWREVGRGEAEVEVEEEDAEEAWEEDARGGTAVARGWGRPALSLDGLRPFARYALTVRAFNRAGPGPPSPELYATTADGVPEAAPRAVSCEPAGARALRVRWRPPPATLPAAPADLRGYDVHYALVHDTPSWRGAGAWAVARAGAGEALLAGLRAAANYSVRVRARAAAGPGPPSRTLYCRTPDDIPGAPRELSALAAGADAVRVTWLPPAERAGRLTHYTLYTRELGKVGGEWSQRVEVAAEDAESGEEEGEVWHEVRGLHARAAFEFWARAHTAAGAGPASRTARAAPQPLGAARISSVSRAATAALGAAVRLRCAAVGAPPLTRRWVPLPPAHTATAAGDLIIHKLEPQWALNYTCAVRNAAGADSGVWSVRARRPPAPPAPRLARAAARALLLAWDAPHDGGAPILGYSVWWWRGWEAGGAARRARAAGGGAALRGLACGAPYRVLVRAHNAAGASPPAPPLRLRTRGDKALAPAGRECIWANSSTLRVSLLAWGGRCPVARWSLRVRRAADISSTAAAWTDMRSDGDVAEAANLDAGTWYEIHVMAHSPAGDTAALFKAATRTVDGERVGEPTELPLEAAPSAAEGAGGAAGGGAGAALAAGGGAAALALAGGGALALLLTRRRRRPRAAPPPAALQPLYVAQPANGKTTHTSDGELHEISPYATFSMATGEARSCALQLRSFARAPSLAAPPPRLRAHPNEYGCTRDSDSESSGSPCAACAAEPYRLPAAHLADTLPVAATESSTEDGSYGGSAGTGAGASAARRPPRRRGAARPPPASRYCPGGVESSRRRPL